MTGFVINCIKAILMVLWVSKVKILNQKGLWHIYRCYIVNWRINKLLLPHNLHSGAKHASLFCCSNFSPTRHIQTDNIIGNLINKSPITPIKLYLSKYANSLTNSEFTIGILQKSPIQLAYDLSNLISTKLYIKYNKIHI